MRRLREIVVAMICCTLRSFVRLLCCSHLAESASDFIERCEKSSPTLFFFLTPSSLSGTADVKRNTLVSHWRCSFTRIKCCIRVNLSTSHLTHNACFTIVPFKLLLSSTGYLHHSASPIPNSKGASRDRQHYVMQEKYLCRPTTRFSQYLTSRMCWVYIGCQHSITNSAQKTRVQFCMRVGNSFFP